MYSGDEIYDDDVTSGPLAAIQRREERAMLRREAATGERFPIRPTLADDEPRPCPLCDSTETVEIHDERQSISICAECGSDEP